MSTKPFAAAPEPITASPSSIEGETVTMDFKHPVSLTLPGYTKIHFREGRQEVPVSLVDHPWLKANGVKRIGGAESYGEMQARVERERIVREDAEKKQKADAEIAEAKLLTDKAVAYLMTEEGGAVTEATAKHMVSELGPQYVLEDAEKKAAEKAKVTPPVITTVFNDQPVPATVAQGDGSGE